MAKSWQAQEELAHAIFWEMRVAGQSCSKDLADTTADYLAGVTVHATGVFGTVNFLDDRNPEVQRVLEVVMPVGKSPSAGSAHEILEREFLRGTDYIIRRARKYGDELWPAVILQKKWA